MKEQTKEKLEEKKKVKEELNQYLTNKNLNSKKAYFFRKSLQQEKKNEIFPIKIVTEKGIYVKNNKTSSNSQTFISDIGMKEFESKNKKNDEVQDLSQNQIYKNRYAKIKNVPVNELKQTSIKHKNIEFRKHSMFNSQTRGNVTQFQRLQKYCNDL